MKVILVKDSKDGKAYTVKDFPGGYASNFLFKNGIAIPFTKENEIFLKEKLANLKIENDIRDRKNLEIKQQIEKTVLWFKLKGTTDGVHGAISSKKIHKALEEQGIIVEKHAVEHISLHSFGTSIVTVKIAHNISAKLKVNITKDE